MFIYTSIFGAMSSYFYLSTFNFLSIILPHTFCNYMGIPPLDFLTNQYGQYSLGTRLFIGTLHILGVIGFLYGTQLYSIDITMSPCTRWKT